jgi:hypothetical protein
MDAAAALRLAHLARRAAGVVRADWRSPDGGRGVSGGILTGFVGRLMASVGRALHHGRGETWLLFLHFAGFWSVGALRVPVSVTISAITVGRKP